MADLASPGSGWGHGQIGFADDGRVILGFSGARPRSDTGTFQYRGQRVVVHRVFGGWHIRDMAGQFIREIADLEDRSGVEHNLTPSADGNRVLLSTSESVPVDLSPYGGPAQGVALQGVVREIDIATGETLFEWKSLGPGGIPLGDSTVDFGSSGDYLHLNAATYDTDGNFLLSATNTGAVYKLDRAARTITWTLGGKRSTVTVSGDPVGLARPQDVRRQADGRLSVFDDHPAPGTARAVAYTLNEQAKTAALSRQFVPSPALPDAGTGGSQPLPNGNYLVTFGAQRIVREYTPSGAVAFEGRFPEYEPYRVQREVWSQSGLGLVVYPECHDRNIGGDLAAIVSLAGATDVATWEVWAGARETALRKVAAFPATDFYTKVTATLGWEGALYRFRAVDSSGRVLATSATYSRGPIEEKYAELGGPGSWLGNPVGDRYVFPHHFPAQNYEHGAIIARTAMTLGALGAYLRSKDVYGPMGMPAADTADVPGGQVTVFGGGVVLESAATGAHWMRTKYADARTANLWLGFPVGDEETRCENSSGGAEPLTRVRFGNGALIETPGEGRVFEVHGGIWITYASFKERCGFLGFPTSNETAAADGQGRFGTFERGAVYWSPATGEAFEVHGAVRNKWAELGAERGFLGYPITNELPTAGNTGAYNHFQRGSVFWSPATGAHEVHGGIRDAWARVGWQGGRLGFPTSDEFAPSDGYRRQDFQGGYVMWSAATGKAEVFYR
ncbi:arylsulfotransferase family protein [Yinghuangia soli]|uniref:Aryl-sulfate sulfotransferase n=1 Tax=Yinghuangia soli TaxID=2908204 RepID=A0AA41PZN1_9ACTN|nr:arylsulfotransferase family protein [Yinghuangia soli]MCF2528768.1 aryl-sulfate sulfotransferase [Yinghuangia soli]